MIWIHLLLIIHDQSFKNRDIPKEDRVFLMENWKEYSWDLVSIMAFK